VAVIADKKIAAVGTIKELEASDHPWIQDYFLGPRGRAASNAAGKAAAEGAQGAGTG
jgi:phospholipid/cholesterol/gamma-HCH transport system ATP-binding protein